MNIDKNVPKVIALFFFASHLLVATPMSGAIGAGLGAAFLLFLAVASLPLIGFLLSLYMFIVERKLKNNPSYKPVCNLSDRISCTKALESPYGRPFGISNALLGLLYYPALVISFFIDERLAYALLIAGGCASLFLAYILYFRIKAFCIICSLIYIINILLLIAITLFVKPWSHF